MNAKVKTVTGPKAAIATFVRPSDQQRIYIFARRGESKSAAIARVMKRHGVEGKEYQNVS